MWNKKTEKRILLVSGENRELLKKLLSDYKMAVDIIYNAIKENREPDISGIPLPSPVKNAAKKQAKYFINNPEKFQANKKKFKYYTIIMTSTYIPLRIFPFNVQIPCGENGDLIISANVDPQLTIMNPSWIWISSDKNLSNFSIILVKRGERSYQNTETESTQEIMTESIPEDIKFLTYARMDTKEIELIKYYGEQKGGLLLNSVYDKETSAVTRLISYSNCMFSPKSVSISSQTLQNINMVVLTIDTGEEVVTGVSTISNDVNIEELEEMIQTHCMCLTSERGNNTITVDYHFVPQG